MTLLLISTRIKSTKSHKYLKNRGVEELKKSGFCKTSTFEIKF